MNMRFTTFADVTTHLDQLGLFHMDMGLDRMHRALTALNLSAPGALPCPVVQIVGTNGKGSTAAFLDALATANGLRAGLYTSPHLASVTERITIGGEPLPEAAWPELANEVYAACPDLTYFEFLTVLGLLAFIRAGVDCIILEAGLGGRYDATTAVHADVVCVTPIDLDHTAVLGPGIARIAADKACAMRPNAVAYTAPQSPDALRALNAHAAAIKCALYTVAPIPPAISLGLVGEHQRVNAALALAAWRALMPHLAGTNALRPVDALGLASAFIPGRLQSIPAAADLPPLLLDGAHNPHGLRTLRTALARLGVSPRAVVFTCMADKDAEAMLPHVRALAGAAPIVVPDLPGNDRACRAVELAARLGPTAQAVSDPLVALAAAARIVDSDQPVLVCGSLYLLGALYAQFSEWSRGATPPEREWQP